MTNFAGPHNTRPAPVLEPGPGLVHALDLKDPVIGLVLGFVAAVVRVDQRKLSSNWGCPGLDPGPGPVLVSVFPCPFPVVELQQAPYRFPFVPVLAAYVLHAPFAAADETRPGLLAPALVDCFLQMLSQPLPLPLRPRLRHNNTRKEPPLAPALALDPLGQR